MCELHSARYFSTARSCFSRKRKYVLYQPFAVSSNFRFAVCALFLNRCVQLLSILTRRPDLLPRPKTRRNRSDNLATKLHHSSHSPLACQVHLLRLHPACSAARTTYDALRHEGLSYLILNRIANLQAVVFTLMCRPLESFQPRFACHFRHRQENRLSLCGSDVKLEVH